MKTNDLKKMNKKLRSFEKHLQSYPLGNSVKLSIGELGVSVELTSNHRSIEKLISLIEKLNQRIISNSDIKEKIGRDSYFG